MALLQKRLGSFWKLTLAVRLDAMKSAEAGEWGANWAWGLPLIIFSVLIHVFGLQFINAAVVRILGGQLPRRRFVPMFAAVMGLTALLATLLHGIEAAIWAGAYRYLGALPDRHALFTKRHD